MGDQCIAAKEPKGCCAPTLPRLMREPEKTKSLHFSQLATDPATVTHRYPWKNWATPTALRAVQRERQELRLPMCLGFAVCGLGGLGPETGVGRNQGKCDDWENMQSVGTVQREGIELAQRHQWPRGGSGKGESENIERGFRLLCLTYQRTGVCCAVGRVSYLWYIQRS